MPTLTERSGVDLAHAIRRREVSASDVLEAHIAMMEGTHPRLNALVAERFAHAREQARSIDQLVAQTSLRGSEALDELPPLLGIPFTVKESIALANMPQTTGLRARRDFRAMETAAAVTRLIDAGAIPVGVTNTSEMTLGIESENPVYGRTNNPYDESRTAGGSSGGEAALVGVGAVPFGVADDVGGSIRIPAMFCGVLAHKPSSGLVPTDGVWPELGGEPAKMRTVGPIARKAEDLILLLRIMAGDPPAEPGSRSKRPFLGEPSEVSLDGLVVTVIEDSSYRPMAREVRDARERAVGALASAGAQLRVVSIPSWKRTLVPFLASLQTSDEEQAGVLALLREAGDPTTSLRGALAGTSGHTVPTKLALIAEALPASWGTRGQSLLARVADLASELTEAIGDGVLLHPAYLDVAPRHRRTYGRPWLTTPAAVFSLAGVPVTEVPLGLSMDGMPVGVQVAAAHGEDHLCIAIALELEAVFGGWVPPFRTH